jgi:hypothetical protein
MARKKYSSLVKHYYTFFARCQKYRVGVCFGFRQRLDTGGGNLSKYFYSEFNLKVKWQKREADNTPPFSAEVRNAWSFSYSSSFSRFKNK